LRLKKLVLFPISDGVSTLLIDIVGQSTVKKFVGGELVCPDELEWETKDSEPRKWECDEAKANGK